MGGRRRVSVDVRNAVYIFLGIVAGSLTVFEIFYHVSPIQFFGDSANFLDDPNVTPTDHPPTFWQDHLMPQTKSDSRLSCMLGEVPLATKLPIYYLNLDRSKERRRYLEAELAPLGPLTRISAADMKNQTVVATFVNTGGQGIEEYARSHDLEPGEIAVTLTHMWAMFEGLRKQQTAILVIEDDATLMLSPFWRKSIDQIVDEATELDPEWHSIQLHAAPQSASLRARWRQGGPLKLVRRYSSGDPTFGTGTMIYSRLGMKALTDAFRMLDEENDKPFKIDCGRGNCRAEGALFSGKAYFVYPPLFQQNLNLGTTGVRSPGNPILSDHFEAHHAWYMYAVLESADGCESSFVDWGKQS